MLLMVLILSSVTVPAAFAAAQCYLTLDEYKEANGVGSWNYNDLAQIIKEVADHACELYDAGEKEEAYEYAKATYWGYYETSGFERNTMNYISGARVSEVELGFTTFRKAVKKDKGSEEVHAAADHLTEMLITDGALLSPEGPVFMKGEAAAAEETAAAEEPAEEVGKYNSPLGYFLTWEEYKNAYQITDWNYNDQAHAIAGVATHAMELYAAGNKDEAYEYAKATYWGYYETSGFERNTMNYISGARVSEVELGFTTFRKAIKKDLGVEAAQAAADNLISMLETDGQILSPGEKLANISTGAEPAPAAAAETQAAEVTQAAAETTTGTSVGTAIAIFLGAFGIILREGLEAILIVGAIIAYLVKSGNKEGTKAVYIGSVLGVAASFIMAGILNHLLARSAEYHMSQEVIEGIAALTAVVVLFYVSNWMVSKAESQAWTNYIESKVQSSASTGNMAALVFTAWLAVFREGAEVILFYQPMLAEGRPDMVWLGFGVGVVALVFVFLAIRYLSIKLPLKPFFMGTSILMAAMSISFLGAGIKELIEGAVFEEFELIDLSWVSNSPSWLSWIPYNDVLDVLGIYPLVGTIVPQLILLAITIVTFVMHINNGKKLAAEAEAKKAGEKQTEAK